MSPAHTITQLHAEEKSFQSAGHEAQLSRRGLGTDLTQTRPAEL